MKPNLCLRNPVNYSDASLGVTVQDSGPGGSVSSFTQHKNGRADWADLKLKNISATTSVWSENRDHSNIITAMISHMIIFSFMSQLQHLYLYGNSTKSSLWVFAHPSSASCLSQALQLTSRRVFFSSCIEEEQS